MSRVESTRINLITRSVGWLIDWSNSLVWVSSRKSKSVEWFQKRFEMKWEAYCFVLIRLTSTESNFLVEKQSYAFSKSGLWTLPPNFERPQLSFPTGKFEYVNINRIIVNLLHLPCYFEPVPKSRNKFRFSTWNCHHCEAWYKSINQSIKI